MVWAGSTRLILETFVEEFVFKMRHGPLTVAGSTSSPTVFEFIMMC